MQFANHPHGAAATGLTGLRRKIRSAAQELRPPASVARHDRRTPPQLRTAARLRLEFAFGDRRRTRARCGRGCAPVRPAGSATIS